MHGSMTLSRGEARSGGIGGWLVPVLLFIAAALLYAITLDDGLAQHDELYHLLAARGLVATGEPSIAEGVYSRGYLYTWLVAQSFGLFGDSLGAARLPALLAMAATVALLFAWLRRHAGNGPAWLATVLFAISPLVVVTAQFARFYSLQTLAFLIACIAVQAALLDPGPAWRRLGLAVLGLAALLLAAELQSTSLIGGIGLALWVGLAVVLPWLLDPRSGSPARRAGLVLAGAALAALAVAGLWASGELADLWYQYRWTPLFNAENSDRFWFYHQWLMLYYPSLWPLVGVLGLLAATRWPRPGLLAVAVTATALLLSSFAGPKNLRYVAYVYPFLFVIWGLGLAAAWPWLRDLGRALVVRLGERLPPPLAGPLPGLLAGGAILLLVLANPFWLRTGLVLADVTIPPEEPNVRWSLARDELAPWVERAQVVVTATELETLYHLGRYDFLVSRSRLSELPAGRREEFARDFRTGRAVIGEAASLERVIDCYDSGLFIATVQQWNRGIQFDASARMLVERRLEPLSLPRGSQLVAYTWERPSPAERPADCTAVDAARPQPAAP